MAITLDVRYRAWATLRRDWAAQLSLSGLLVRVEADLAQFDPVTVRLYPPGEGANELPGKVLQVIPGQGVAIQFEPEAGEALRKLGEAADRATDAGPPGSDDPTFTISGRGSSMTGPQLAADPQELRRQLEAMSVNEKRQAALHGRREVRLLLIKDVNKAVHPFVVKNPAITVDEIEAIAKMPLVNPDALRMIAANREWTRSAGVCRALVRNPQTPVPEALMLLDKHPIGDVRMLAKSANVKTAIQAAARKKVNQ